MQSLQHLNTSGPDSGSEQNIPVHLTPAPERPLALAQSSKLLTSAEIYTGADPGSGEHPGTYFDSEQEFQWLWLRPRKKPESGKCGSASLVPRG